MHTVVKPIADLTSEEFRRCSRQTFGPDDGDMWWTLRECDKSRSYAIMAFDDNGKQIGWSLAFYTSPRAVRLRAMFYVKTRYRGRGIGSALMDEVRKIEPVPQVYPHDEMSAGLFNKYRHSIRPVYGVNWLTKR